MPQRAVLTLDVYVVKDLGIGEGACKQASGSKGRNGEN